MKVIVCVDEKNGMLFNNRRQSRDIKVIERILEITKDSKLWITNFSKELFVDKNVNIADDFLEKIGEEDYIFLENVDISKIQNNITELVIFNWNRHYPADVFLEISLENFKIISTKEFEGNSHEKITEIIYRSEMYNENI